MTFIRRNPVHVCVLGFSAFERNNLLSALLATAGQRRIQYEGQVLLSQADVVVADVAHAASMELVQATERGEDTLFIGARRPKLDAPHYLPQPYRAEDLLTALDKLVIPRMDPKWASLWMPLSEAVPVRPRAAPLGDVSLLPVAAAAASSVQVVAQVVAQVVPAPAVAPATTRPTAAVAMPRQSGPGGGAALVVDTSEVALRFISRRLALYGFDVVGATSSEAAQELLAQRRFDLVLLDFALGDGKAMNGLILCREIRRQLSGTPFQPLAVVVMAALPTAANRARSERAGCDAFINKPPKESDLRPVLERVGWRPRLAPRAQTLAPEPG